jgi:hypothetical protein
MAATRPVCVVLLPLQANEISIGVTFELPL